MATVKKSKDKKQEVIDDLDFDEEIQCNSPVEQEEDYVFIQVDPKTLSQQKEQPKELEKQEQPIELTEEQIKKNIQEKILSYKKRNNIDKKKI